MRGQNADRLEREPFVLIVDDEITVLDVTRSMASSLGWHALVANTAEAALSVFRDHAPRIRLVLVDLHMPGTDGAALARRLRQVQPDVPIALMTGDETEARALLESTHLADGLLVKPFVLDDLEHVLAAPARAA